MNLLYYFYVTLHMYSFFLSFALNKFVSFILIALFPTWHLALVLFSSLYFSQFCSGRYTFWFPLFTGSNYCTLFLFDCFNYAYECVCICVYSVTFFIVVINFCINIWLFQFCGVFPVFFFFSFFFHFFFFFKIILTFHVLKLLYFFYMYSFVGLSYFFSPYS